MRIILSFFFVCICTFPIQAKTYCANTQGQLYFIENKGQIKDQFSNPRKDIQFVLQGQGISVFVSKGQLQYQFQNKKPNAGSKRSQPLDAHFPAPGSNTYDMYRLDVVLTGANKNAEVVAEEPQAYYEHYYLPGSTDNMVTAHTYKKVTYKNIYPFIDWVVYIKNNKPEYDFIVNPGGNADDIKIKYKGANTIACTDGRIIIKTPLGDISEQNLYAYEQTTHKQVAASFRLKNKTLKFSLPETDNTHTAIVIDPELEWGTYYGLDTSTTYFYDIVCDQSADIYGAGLTYAAGSIATTGSHQAVYAGNADAYLVKFDSSGHRLWATYYGGPGGDWGSAVACDPQGNVYLAGSTNSSTGIATPGCAQPFFGGGLWGGYLAKFTPAGTLLWGTYLGGTPGTGFNLDIGSVSCDLLGHVYVSGATDDTANIATPGSFKPVKHEGQDTAVDCFLVQYDTAGVKQWGTYYGGPGRNYTLGGVNSNDGYNVYLSGYTNDTVSGSIATAGSYQQALKNNTYDAFLAKFNASGARLWGTYYGGEQNEEMGGIVVNKNGYIYMFGTTFSDTGMASAACYQPLRGGGMDGFLALFDPEAGYRQWGTYYGGPGDENAQTSRIASDGSGGVFVTGYTSSTSGIASVAGWKTNYGGGVADAFLARYNDSGRQQWATYYGGNANDQGFACAYDGHGIYICGLTNSTDSIATTGSFLSFGGGYALYKQGFLAKFADPPPSPILGTGSLCAGGTDTLADSTTGGIWSSGSPAVATIGSASGIVNAIAAGTAIITYTIATGTTATFVITVNPLPAAISGADTLCYAATTTLADSSTGGIWKSSNYLLAYIDSVTGTVSGIGPGVAIITYTLPTGCYTTAADTVMMCYNGVPLLNLNANDIDISPNPAITTLTITPADKITTISVSNFLGEMVLRGQYNPAANANSLQLDVSCLPPGVYFILFNGMKTKKFVKQ